MPSSLSTHSYSCTHYLHAGSGQWASKHSREPCPRAALASSQQLGSCMVLQCSFICFIWLFIFMQAYNDS
jgi:hypothetical protein